jgi:dihydroorotate dehydrogenase
LFVFYINCEFYINIKEIKEMASMLNAFDLVGIELNASCPNTEGDCLQNAARITESCKAIKKETDLPLILKLSVVHPIEKIIPQVEGTVEAISINSVPWKVVFPDRKSSLEHLGSGGISGKIAQPYTWSLVKELVKITNIPVIGPSVWEFSDIRKLLTFYTSFLFVFSISLF